MMTAIRPFMNGELPISSPVSGLRSGAPGGSVSRPKTTTSADQAEERVASARATRRRESAPPALSASAARGSVL